MEATSSELTSDLAPDKSDEESSPVATSSNDDINNHETPESSFRNSEDISYRYELSCPSQSSHYHTMNSELVEMPGSSKVSVSLINSSEVSASSSLMIDPYSLHSDNSLSPQSTTLLNPAANLQVPASSSTDSGALSRGNVSFKASGKSIHSSPSTSVIVHENTSSHDNSVISTTNQSEIIEIVGSSQESVVESEIQSSDIQPSCRSEISWPASSPVESLSSNAETSQGSCNNSTLVTYSLANQQDQENFPESIYPDVHYQLSTTSNENLVFSSVRFSNPSSNFSAVQPYSDITSLTDSYHPNAPSSSGLHMFHNIAGDNDVESSTENHSNNVVSSNAISKESSSEAEALGCVDSQMESSDQQLDSTTDNDNVTLNSGAVDSTADLAENMSDVGIGSTTRVLSSSTDISNQHLNISYSNASSQPELVDGSGLLSSEAQDEQSVDLVVSETGVGSLSNVHQYSNISEVISIDEYPSTSNGQIVMNNIDNQLCDDDDLNQQKMSLNIMQHQNLMTTMLQPMRQFYVSQLHSTESNRRQLIATSFPESLNLASIPLSTYATSSSTSIPENSLLKDISKSEKPVDMEMMEFSTENNESEIPNHHGEIADDPGVSQSHNSDVLDMSTSSMDLSSQSEIIHERKESDHASSKMFWCEECSAPYNDHCPEHQIRMIYDKPVLPRAWASLPAAYLSVKKIVESDDSNLTYGVFAKKSIPKRTQFGPVEGVITKFEDKISDEDLALCIEANDIAMKIDTSDEMTSNWMRFVRIATDIDDMNLAVVQKGQFIYFNTTKAINSRAELKVHYSPSYGKKWGLNFYVSEEFCKSWPCFECEENFSTSDGLQQHLNDHDSDSGSEGVQRNLRKKARAKKAVKEQWNKNSSKCFDNSSNDVVENSTEVVEENSQEFKPVINTVENRQFDSSDLVQNQTEEKSLHECNICQKSFPKDLLQKHMAKHSGEKKFKCPICDMTFSHLFNRNRHVQKHKAQSQEESAPKSLYKRKQIGSSEWLCTHCNLTFDNSSLLNLHTLTHAAENVSMLDGVSGTDSNSSQLSTNVTSCEKPTEEASLKCPQCTKEFDSKKDLIQHASEHGKPVTNKRIKPRINARKPFKCELCYKSFATEDRLSKHMMIHGSDENKHFECPVCSKKFFNKPALSCHVKVHSGEKKTFACPICKEVFLQIFTLRLHVPIHCVDGNFTCPTCNKNFAEYNQIRKHIHVFHSDKTYPCEHCQKIFSRPDKLKLHLLSHSNHREFLCANCGKQFKRKDKLKEHMKRVHSPESEKARAAAKPKSIKVAPPKKFSPKVSPTDYHRFIYKCHDCLLGFKRRGMLVNHLAKRHPTVRLETVPELNLPILQTTKDYYCQYCNKVYKSNSKRKAHILKNHPGAELPVSQKKLGNYSEIPGIPNPTYTQTVGCITTFPYNCDWCHKQYASKPKLYMHHRKKHADLLALKKHKPAELANQATITNSTEVTLDPNLSQFISENNEDMDIISKKDKLNTLISANSVAKGHFVDRDNNIIANVELKDQAACPDLLTQAMTEITQRMNEFRQITNNENEYLHLVTSSAVPNNDILEFKVMAVNNSTTSQEDDSINNGITVNASTSNQTTLVQNLLGHLIARPFNDSSQTVATVTQKANQELSLDESSFVTVPQSNLGNLVANDSFNSQAKLVNTLEPTNLSIGLNAEGSQVSISMPIVDQPLLLTNSEKNENVPDAQSLVVTSVN